MPVAQSDRYTSALRRITHGVIEQYDDHLLDPVGIGHAIRHRARTVNNKMNALLRDGRSIAAGDIVHKVEKIDARKLHIFGSGLEAAERHHIRDEPRKAHDLVQHYLIIALAILFLLYHSVGERLKQTAKRRKRRAQLMRNVGDVFPSHALDSFHLGHILKERDNADLLTVFCCNGRYRYPKDAVSGHGVSYRPRFARNKHLVEFFPDIVVGYQVLALRDAHGAEHAHKRRVVMRKFSAFIGCSNAVRQALKYLIELTFFGAQLFY